jgi:hypothetical protein
MAYLEPKKKQPVRLLKGEIKNRGCLGERRNLFQAVNL